MATPILMPRQGQSVESCILVRWLVKPGDAVKAGHPIASIETDKATFEVECPEAGTVLALFFSEGDDIPVLTNIAAVGQPGENADALRPCGTPAPAATAAPEPTKAAAPLAAPVAAAKDSTEAISPRARNTAARAGVDASTLAGTGPGGRVIERDVLAAAARGGHLSPAAREKIAAGGQAAPAHGSGPGGMVLSSDLQDAAAASAGVPVKGIRKIIAERMRQSLSTTAQLTMTMSFDLTAIQQRRAAAKERGEKLTINDILVHTTAQMLKKHPDLNAHFLGDRIARFAAVHLGIAVDTPRGLMVPVLRNADRMSPADIGQAIRPLAEACQAGSINPDLLAGGTFTITNLGALGVETFTPVLNAPEVAILGVGGIQWKHLVRDGRLQLVESITLSLTVDHQAVDGAPAARFLKDLCAALEQKDGS